MLPNKNIASVFFGGDTPSLITPQNISRLIDKISELWTVSSNCEISLEANPNTQTPTLFQDLKNAGIAGILKHYNIQGLPSFVILERK